MINNITQSAEKYRKQAGRVYAKAENYIKS